MKISNAIELLKKITAYNLEQYEADLKNPKISDNFIVPIFVGDPGIGKTAIPRQAAREMDLWYGQAIIAQFDAGELAGLPWLDKQQVPLIDNDGKPIKNEKGEIMLGEKTRMIRIRPDYLPDPEVPEQHFGIFNLDELAQAFLASQNIASQIVNEYRVGKHEIPKGITMCATSNKPENKAGTTSMPTHLRDRLMFITVEVSVDDWLAHAAQRRYDPRIRAYIRQNPKSLHSFDPAAFANPTPRSWEKAGGILTMGLSREVRSESLGGQIGQGEAIKFEAWLRVEDKLPKLEDILKNPEKAPVFGPKDADINYLLLSNLADIATQENVGAILKYIERLPQQEFTIYWASDALSRDKSLREAKPFHKWLVSKGSKLMI